MHTNEGKFSAQIYERFDRTVEKIETYWYALAYSDWFGMGIKKLDNAWLSFMYIISLEDLEDQLPRVREPPVNDQHRQRGCCCCAGIMELEDRK